MECDNKTCMLIVPPIYRKPHCLLLLLTQFIIIIIIIIIISVYLWMLNAAIQYNSKLKC